MAGVTKPNIVFVLCDNVGWGDFGVYGGGTATPRIFILRQDAAITDASVPTPAQFGGTTPLSYGLISDDGTLTLTPRDAGGLVVTVDLPARG